MPDNNFGTMLRGLRTGFYYAERLKAYVRMSYLNPESDLVQIEICPPKRLHFVTRRGTISPSLEHIVWNKGEGGPEAVLDRLHLPQTRFTCYTTYVVNGEGNVVSQ